MKYLYGLIIILLIIGGVYYLNQNKQTVPDNEEATALNEAVGVEGALSDGIYQLDPAASTINWTGRKTLVANYEDKGTLKYQSGEFNVSSTNQIEGDLTIDMTSIEPASTGRGDGESLLANHLKSDDFFGVETYPEAKFVLQSINDQGVVTGQLTMKGVTQPVSFPATISTANGQLLIEATFDLDRTLWNVRFGSDKFFDNLANNVIDDNFTVETRIVAEQIAN